MKKHMMAALLLAMALAGCGGGGSSNPPQTTQSNPTTTGGTVKPTTPTTTTTSALANQVSVVVGGTTGSKNSPLVSVTLCQTGTSNCTTIPNILVDTGSTGLRVFKSVLPTTLSLAAETSPSTGNALSECMNFAGGVAWGPMVLADVKMAGETGSSVPVQVIDNTSALLPSSCSSENSLMTQSALMANGILGIASARDCGDGCITAGTGSWYFECTASSCTSYGAPWAQQTTNPVTKFAADNNGAILSFPGLANGVSASVTGTLTFGLDTQSDNSSTGVSLVEGVSNGMATTYNGSAMLATFDSGSTSDFIGSAPFPTCTVYGLTWFCPTSTTTQSAAFQGGGLALSVSFKIANAQTVLAQSGIAFADVAESSTLFSEEYLDLGMSYLYGHNLFLGYPGTTGTAAMIGVQDNQATVQ
ncbi:DUF3443 family protein [Paraburkholderia sp. EG287A]|uniref:DUF3443 family protein n=1 Tax=Paraburkholderia sp. EG287A TaxID=3237012 RepID=UPI0034D34732